MRGLPTGRVSQGIRSRTDSTTAPARLALLSCRDGWHEIASFRHLLELPTFAGYYRHLTATSQDLSPGRLDYTSTGLQWASFLPYDSVTVYVIVRLPRVPNELEKL